MKKIIIFSLFVSLLFTNCATHYGIPTNINHNTTEVVLTKNNFKVVGLVKGEAEATYVLGIGGLSKNGLIAEATANMLASSQMEGASRCVINEVVEVKTSGIFFISKRKVIVSAQVIEFID